MTAAICTRAYRSQLSPNPSASFSGTGRRFARYLEATIHSEKRVHGTIAHRNRIDDAGTPRFSRRRRALRPRRGSSPASNTTRCIASRLISRRPSGATRPANCTGSRSGTRCWTGSCPTRSGLSAGKTNVAYNCLDQQIEQGRGEQDGDSLGRRTRCGRRQRPEVRRDQLSASCAMRSCRFANGLKKLGVKKGDRVTIYMPMVPEAAVAMLACAARRVALGDLRRVLQPGDRRSRRGCQERRSSSPPTAGIAAGRSWR